MPATFELATELVRPGGHVANIGVHGGPATLHLETLWTRDVTITTGLVDTYSTPTLSRLVATHQLDVARFATHHFPLDQFMEAYEVFPTPPKPARSRSFSPVLPKGSVSDTDEGLERARSER